MAPVSIRKETDAYRLVLPVSIVTEDDIMKAMAEQDKKQNEQQPPVQGLSM